MGSEHYCLRWNNHQSNLLGVFSQLLQDESLVDVTLACSEGASIRAHKVVLSACSSYFQALFLDHPSRHPIVILKDVRYPELRTLIEFMYKGEVNVQYCQLSALLKTAESLKVKGLAEMTNQSTAYHEPEREHERLRPHSVTSKNNNNETLETSAATTTTSSSIRATPTSTLTSNSRLEADRNNSPISPTRLHNPHSPTTPLALYQRKLNRDHHLHHHNISETQISPSSNNNNNNNNNDFGGKGPSGSGEQQLFGCVSGNNKDDRPSSPDDDAMSNDVGERLSKFTMQHKFLYSKENLGLNMSLNPNSLHPSLTVGAVPSSLVGLPPPISISSHPSDLRPLSRGGSGLSGSSSVPSMMNSSREMVASGSGLPSPMSEPIAGPSGMGPVQQVPLSLKKEIEWDRHEDKLIGGEGSSSEFRHPHDAEGMDPHHDQGGPMYPCMYCGASFPHQSKLTRHILSHSLETLKYRETAHRMHPGHMSNFLPHPEMSPQSFTHRGGPPKLEPLEPPDGSMPMEIEFAAAAAAAAASSNSSLSNLDQGSVVLCKFCGKSFPDVSSLITHLPVHTGDRPFKCEFCGKAFKLRHHMKDHCRVHTGERPFRCGMCGKTFSRSTILKAHEKTHYPKYVRKFLSPSPVDTKEEPPQ